MEKIEHYIQPSRRLLITLRKVVTNAPKVVNDIYMQIEGYLKVLATVGCLILAPGRA